MPFSLQEMLSSAPHPTPLRQEPKAPCFSEPACGSRPPESDPRLGLRTDHAERGGSRQGVRPRCPAPGAACRVGRSSRPIPLRSCPIPKQYTPPPAGPLPTLRGAASLAACRRWPRAAQAASERAERSGMGLGGSGERGDSGSTSGFFLGSHERFPRRAVALGAARRPATKTRESAPLSRFPGAGGGCR